MVVAPAMAPQQWAACLAGACLTPANKHRPTLHHLCLQRKSQILIALEIATPPNSGAEALLSDPWKLPIGDRAAPIITIGSVLV